VSDGGLDYEVLAMDSLVFGNGVVETED